MKEQCTIKTEMYNMNKNKNKNKIKHKNENKNERLFGYFF